MVIGRERAGPVTLSGQCRVDVRREAIVGRPGVLRDCLVGVMSRQGLGDVTGGRVDCDLLHLSTVQVTVVWAARRSVAPGRLTTEWSRPPSWSFRRQRSGVRVVANVVGDGHRVLAGMVQLHARRCRGRGVGLAHQGRAVKLQQGVVPAPGTWRCAARVRQR